MKFTDESVSIVLFANILRSGPYTCTFADTPVKLHTRIAVDARPAHAVNLSRDPHYA